MFELSGKLPQYEDWYISENPHKDYPLKIQTPTGIIEINKGENNGSIAQELAPRIQINLAIKNHLEKQFDILSRGENIKALYYM